MKQIQISLSAKNYADALVKLGRDGIMPYDEILKNLEIAEEICNNSNDLVEVLINPTISIETKNAIVEEVFTTQIDEKIKDFLKILIDKKRFNEYNGIVCAYRNELDKINNIKRVEIISAVELDENDKKRVIEKLQQKLHKNVIAEWQQNTEIIGGLVIKIEDNVIDTSLRNKIENLSKNLSI